MEPSIDRFCATVKIRELSHQYVEHLPEQLEDGVLYICKPFELAAHRCCCGCGEEVITSLNKAKWSLHERRGRVSLKPSVGNWKFACQSHYWITNNRVYPAGRMSKAMIEWVIEEDRTDAQLFAQERSTSTELNRAGQKGFIARVWLWIMRLRG